MSPFEQYSEETESVIAILREVKNAHLLCGRDAVVNRLSSSRARRNVPVTK